MKITRRIISVVCGLLIFVNAFGLSAFAEVALPDGAVKGLPERLAALDDEGNAVNSQTGEYFFRVENMDYGETYTKNIQLMNLREDKSYHIYFYVEPLFKEGEIDLEKGCECRFYLDGTEIYKGDVNGKGSIDLNETHFDCGHYDPGESHTLRCEIVWNEIDVIQNVDNGHRLIDRDGEHVLVGPGDEGHAEGEIEFKWIFYAQVDEDESSSDESSSDESTSDESTSNPGGGNTPFTGVLGHPAFWVGCIAVLTVMIGRLLILLKRKQDKEKH